MAPQQNSTLIDENLDVCPSLINIPEEISRYSPILPPKSKQIQNHDKNNNHNNNNNDSDNINNHHQQDVKFVRNWEYAETEREIRHHHNHHHQHQHHYKQNQYKCKQHRSGSIRSGHSRRSRSISLYGVNSTMEQGHKEITIWLGDEPRYVWGVTNKTTCNDIIKALIDDEIRCGNYDYCHLTKDGTASRDYSDYVITECWRGIERSYDNNMAILPVWKAWSRVHNEIRLSLKHHKDIQDPSKALKTNTTLSSIRNYICKLLKFGKRKTNKKKSQKSKACSEKSQPREKKQPKSQNDIILVLTTECVNEPAKDCDLKTPTEEVEDQAKNKINKDKLYRLSESRSTQRKRKSTRRRKESRNTSNKANNFDLNSNYLRRRKDATIRSSVRNKLAQKNAEMNELFDREYALTKELTNKCKLYKLQNELYTKADQDLEISVEQIQRNIEAYAKEIIQTEHELLEVKNELRHDISIVNNLKRLTLDSNPNECGVPIEQDDKMQPTTNENPTSTTSQAVADQMQFVDNIYEFCDNNASMLV